MVLIIWTPIACLWGTVFRCFVQDMIKNTSVLALLTLLPKWRNLIIWALTYCTLVRITHSLLSPEGALIFHIDFICFEERGGLNFKLLWWSSNLYKVNAERKFLEIYLNLCQDWMNLMVQLVKMLNRSANTIDVSWNLCTFLNTMTNYKFAYLNSQFWKDGIRKIY